MRVSDVGTERLVRSAERVWHALLVTGASAAVLPVRLLVGMLFFAHGSQKLFGWFGGAGPSGTGAGFEQMGFSPGTLWAVVAGLIEVGAGLLLASGLVARVAASVLTLFMLVAMFAVHWENGFFLNWSLEQGRGHGIEFNLALIAALLAVAIYGGGGLSLDRMITRRDRS